jgi:TP901 family phage tail tape measure protein
MAIGDRTVAVRLLAETSGYVSGMNQAALAAWRVERQTQRATASASKSIDGTTKSVGRLGNVFMGLGGIVGVGMGAKALGVLMDFEQAVAALGAAAMSTEGELELMRAAALRAGQDTAFTGTQAANAMEELAKAGVGTADILGGALDGALALAAAGPLDVALAAETAATAMVQFGLAGTDVTHIADLLAAGAGKAQGSVEDLALAMRQGGQVASMVGWSLEDTTTALTVFAANGLLSSDAGTSLKTMLLRLANPSNEAARLMEQLGLQVYGANGQMLGATAMAGALTRAFADLDPEARNAAMGIIFGTDATRAANVLFSEGATGMLEWGAAVQDAGFAAEVAGKKNDTLRGDLNRLRGTMEAILNTEGTEFLALMRDMVQLADLAAKAISGLGNSFVSPAFAAIPSIGGPIGIAVDAIRELPAALDESLAEWNRLLSGETILLYDFRQLDPDFEPISDAEVAKIQEAGEATRFMNAAVASTEQAARSATEATYGFAYSQEELEAKAKEAADRLDNLESTILNLGGAYRETTGAQDDLQSSINDLQRPFEQIAEAEADLAEARQDYADATTDASKASAADAVAKAEAALAAAQAAATLIGTSDAAIANRDAMRAMADQTLLTAFSLATVGGDAKGAKDSVQLARDAVIDAATQMGYGQTKAERYADKLGLIPEDVDTEVRLYGNEQAMERANAYLLKLQEIDGFVATAEIRATVVNEATTEQLGSGHYAHNRADGGWIGRPDGGWVPGSGSGRSDNVNARLTPGEFVVSASAAAAFGPLLQSINALGTAVATIPGGVNFNGPINVKDGRDLVDRGRLERLVRG